MIKVFSFQPEYFNNNGDQGNLLVLEWELAACGSEIELVSDIDSADFVLFGDASRAAMRHFEQELEQLRPAVAARWLSAKPTLVVGSCYEFFASELGLSLKRGTRYSGFVTANDDFGYQNSDGDLPAVHANGGFIATNLFGPFLAKNPHRLQQLCGELGQSLELDAKRLRWIAEIRRRSSVG